MANDGLLPIKVVLPRVEYQVRNDPGGGARKIFAEVDQRYREELAQLVTGVAGSYSQAFLEKPNVPAVAKVLLKRDALAKSHRPDRILTEHTCPIIGVGTFRELFISVTPSGLDSLATRIRTDTTIEAKANISAVESIEPLSQVDRIGTTGSDALHLLQRQVDSDGLFKVQLFDHHDEQLNKIVFDDFVEWLTRAGAELGNSTEYTPSLIVHEVLATGEQVPDIIEHRGIRRAGILPRYTALRQRSTPVSGGDDLSFDGPDPDEVYPRIGVIDSGISLSCASLDPWVYKRENYVAAGEENQEHGTFVAGILTWGSLTNPSLDFDPGGPSLLLDVAALPNGDTTHGPVGELTETELIAILQEVIPKYRDVVRVWNLSLGSDQICSDSAFSDLAVALDEIQRNNDVQFVISAGNYEQPPFRSWPPQSGIGNADRICAPADSVRAVTVGSLAHSQNTQSVVQVNEPSPFSRRGPGPSYVVKPDLVNYGGNCDHAGDYLTTGVRSIDAASRLAEDAGTSFAAPFVSSLIANVANAIDPSPSLNLVKALVVHSAGLDRLRWTKSSGEDINYVGFGLPRGTDAVLFSTQSAATLVFEDELEPGSHLELDPFPYPECLIHNGRSVGRIRMTLVYDPPLNPSYGLEYCRANVTASLGTVRINRQTGEFKYDRMIPPDPVLHGQGYEEDLIKFGFKWCPVKSYQREFARGTLADHWKLRVDLLHRHDELPTPQRFALVITIAGDQGQPVYDDLVSALRVRETQDLPVKSQVRQRLQARATPAA